MIRILIFILFLLLIFMCGEAYKPHRYDSFYGGNDISSKLMELGISKDKSEKIEKIVESECSNNCSNPFVKAIKIDQFLQKVKPTDNLEDVERIRELLGFENQNAEMIVVNTREEKEEGLHIYTCPKCGKSNHSSQEVLLRSSDEPTSSRNICLECGFKWTID